MMKITSIKWSGRVEDVTHIGTKTGTKFVSNKAVVDSYPYGNDRVEKIEEINLTTYEIYYYKYGVRTKLRVFNPIEVLFTEET